MKLFEAGPGFIIAVGFDMNERRVAPFQISWSDADGRLWVPRSNNQAGDVRIPLRFGPLATQFVRVVWPLILLYQPGLLIEMEYIGGPIVFQFRFLEEDKD